MYNGGADNKSIISLLIYLADKGYLKIEEIKGKSFFSNEIDSYRIIKLKNYDGNNEYERIFFEDLFSDSNKSTISQLNKQDNGLEENGITNFANKFNGNTEEKNTQNIEENNDEKEVEYVTQRDLYGNFYKTIDTIKARMNSGEIREAIFDKSSKKAGIFIIVIMSIIGLLGTILSSSLELDMVSTEVMLYLFFTLPAILVLDIGVMKKGKNDIKEILGAALYGGIPLVFCIAGAFTSGKWLILLFAIISLIILYNFIRISSKRTKVGNELYGKIKGFRNFLETAEKPKLEELVMQNPTYFYDILPYTYALGISDKWMKKFETMQMSAPNWYSSYRNNGFNIYTFNHFVNRTMASASSASYSSSSSSSSSGGSSSFSGGGSSGGGSGGGRTEVLGKK